LARKAFKPEQIINKLREAEILISQGATIGEASRKIGVTEQTYYRWRRGYGDMGVEQARRLRELHLPPSSAAPISPGPLLSASAPA